MKAFLMSLAMIFAVTVTNAQPKSGKFEAKSKVEAEKLAEALGFNDDVQTKIYEILLNEKRDARTIVRTFDAGDLNEEEKDTKLKELAAKKEEDIKALLTPEQQKAYTELKE